MLPECCSPNHAGDGPFLYGPWRLCDFYPLIGYLYRAARARFFSRGTLRDPSMAISSRYNSWLNRRIRCDLVSIERTRSTYCAARLDYRLHRHILLGALRRPGQTSFRAARLDSQFWFDQLHNLDTPPALNLRFWKDRHSASRGPAR